MKDPIIWLGSDAYYKAEYDDIIEFDGKTVKLGSNGQTGYVTHLPLSPLEYRRKKEYKEDKSFKSRGFAYFVNISILTTYYTQVTVVDDWGTHYNMLIPQTRKEDIQRVKQALIENELFKSVVTN